MPSPVIDRAAFERRPVKPIQSTFFNSILVNLEFRHDEDPSGTLAALPWAVMEATGAQSAGVSVLIPGPGSQSQWQWAATGGRWSTRQGATFAPGELPCALALQSGQCQAIGEPAGFAAWAALDPPPAESLHVPVLFSGASARPPCATLWAVLHHPAGQFDSQDAFMLQALAQLAARLLPRLGA